MDEIKFKTLGEDPISGFAIVKREVIRYLSSSELAVYALLSSFVGSENEDEYPSVSTISKLTGYSVSSVNRLIGSLRNKGFIAKKRTLRCGVVVYNVMFPYTDN